MKVGVKEKVSGKGRKLEVLAREIRSTEKSLSAGYMGRDLFKTFRNQEGKSLKKTGKSRIGNKLRCLCDRRGWF